MTSGDPIAYSNPSAPATDHVVEPTGTGAGAGSAEDRIGTGLADLDQLAARPLGEHAAAYDSLHDELQAVLSEIDSA